MKLKTNIAKLLAAGLLLNNIYFYSNANTLDNEIPGRYETLEGEYITIDDSMEGTLEEIEIFGNTVQDPNNLEDIQSVGDLYVDKNGNPILDRQGREQYKIDIVSSNRFPIVKNEWKASLNKELSFSDRYSCASFNTFGYTKPGDHVRIHLKIKKISDSYNFSNPIALTSLDSGGYNQYLITNSEWINLPVGESIEKTIVRTIDIKDRSYVSLHVGQPGENTDPTSNTGTFIIEDVGLDIMSSSTTEIKENKTKILLPTQLQKIGDITDRLFWDEVKNRYVIEKNIGKTLLDGGKGWMLVENSDTHQKFYTGRPAGCKYGSKNINSKFKNIADNSYTSEFLSLVPNLDLCIEKSRLNDLTSNSLNEWLALNPIIIYFENEYSELIDTNIISKFKIPTYNEKTYIYTSVENNVNPKLKVTVDRLPQIAKNSVEEAKINSNTSNISLARMYINMLPESLYKDQLQEQLSQVFSSDITLDRKTTASNLDVYVKSQNMLSISLDTNSITFDGYSGVDAMEMLSAVNISINSSLPYDLNAYMPTEITNSDGSNTIDFDILNIKESSESVYQQFTDTINKVILKSDCAKGNGNIHNIDLKLDSNTAYKADVYKTVIKFEAEQK